MNIKRVKKAFRDAENLIKEYEHVNDKLLVPAVNELRYAGYHFLKAFGDDGNLIKNTPDLAKAERHCQRSRYDTSEAIATFYIRNIRAILGGLKEHPEIAKQVFGDYEALRSNAKTMTMELKSFSSEDRESYHEQCLDLSKRAKGVYDALSKREDQRWDIIEARRNQENQETRRYRHRLSWAS